MVTRVRVIHPSFGEIMTRTVDISDGGASLSLDEWAPPGIGEKVKVQVQDLPMEAPIVEMRIVHIGPESVGLEFTELN